MAGNFPENDFDENDLKKKTELGRRNSTYRLDFSWNEELQPLSKPQNINDRITCL